jgi:hypothetical protein
MIMFRRLVVFVTFITIGLAAGLALPGRMRPTDITSAAPAQPESAPQSSRAPALATAGLPDLTNIA